MILVVLGSFLESEIFGTESKEITPLKFVSSLCYCVENVSHAFLDIGGSAFVYFHSLKGVGRAAVIQDGTGKFCKWVIVRSRCVFCV